MLIYIISMKKMSLIIILFLIIGGLVFCFRFVNHKKETRIMPEQSQVFPQNKKKVAVIIAFTDFKDEEYFGTREELEKAGIEIEVVSNLLGTAQGVSGGEVNITKTLKEVNVDDYDGIVFIGGPGALSNLGNSDSYRIAREAVSKNKILAAICISPVILAKAGVLNGKNATVWSSVLDRSPVEELKKNGAIYIDKSVVVDGKIITGNGPSAASEFGRTIAEKLR